MSGCSVSDDDGMNETRVVVDGLGFPESTRWRDGRIWLCNWGAGEVLALSIEGEREVMARLAPHTIPLSIDWLPDGRMLVVDGPGGRLLRQEPDGTLDIVADLTAFGSPPFNEIVIDATGNAYVNGGPGVIRVQPDGGMRKVADGLPWPNGMALVDDGRTLVVADSRAEQLVAFEVADDGTLSDRRVWADLERARRHLRGRRRSCVGCERSRSALCAGAGGRRRAQHGRR